MKILGTYKNGNYRVIILSDGTKIRYNKEAKLIPSIPESMDIKITNYCDIGCPMCHENSTIAGSHGDILNASFIDMLHPFTELAIGGGNPLSHPDLIPFLQKCKSLKLIPSMTVNQRHFMDNVKLIEDLVADKLIYGLGISVTKVTDEFLAEVEQFDNAVLHVINGLVTVETLQQLKDRNLKILILGYKEVRRGYDLYADLLARVAIDRNKDALGNILGTILEEHWFNTVSFDNLALEQLNVKQYLLPEEWDEFFMGDDGIGNEFDSATMYIDMVEKKFAKNSCDPIRYDLLSTADEMYKFLQDKYAQK